MKLKLKNTKTLNILKAAAVFSISTATSGIIFDSVVESSIKFNPFTIQESTCDDMKVMLSTDNVTFKKQTCVELTQSNDKYLLPLKMQSYEFYYSPTLDVNNAEKVELNSEIVEKYTYHTKYYVKTDKLVQNLGLYISLSYLGGEYDIDNATCVMLKYNTDKFYAFSYNASAIVVPEFTLTNESQEIEMWIYRDLTNEYISIENINNHTDPSTLRLSFIAYGFDENGN